MENAAAGRKQKSMDTSKIVKIGMLSAVSVVLMMFEFALPIFPSFLQIDISDLPALVGALEDIVYQIRWMQAQEQAKEWQADSPLPGWDGDGIRMEDAIPCAGVWGIAETRAQAVFSRVLDNEYGLEQYEVTADGYRERGVYYYYINNDAGAEFPDDFPQDQYIWYKLVVTPAEITGTAPNPQADMESYQSWGATVDVFQSADSSETYFRQWDTPWLPADSAVHAQNAGGADEADALLGSGFGNL